MHIPDAALGAIIAALISGAMVYITTVLSKEQKTSEFRQVWIDGLRNDVSDYIAKVTSLYSIARSLDGILHPERVKVVIETREDAQEAYACEYRILLRLNPHEHKNLISKINLFQINISKLKAISKPDGKIKSITEQEEELSKDLIIEVQKIIKSEWGRVKKGESSFRLLKVIAILTMLIAVISFFIYLICL